MANEYITVPELKATLSISGSSLDADLALAAETASRAIDKACSRRGYRKFWEDTDDVIRTFTPYDDMTLEIPDLMQITSVRTDEDGDGGFEVTWATTDYYLEPLNAVVDNEPWRLLCVHPAGNHTLPTQWPGSVEVTGHWGWADTPPAIKQATVLLASRLVKRSREAPFAVIGFGIDQGVALHIARTDPDVSGLIKDYIRDRGVSSVRAS